MNRVFKYISVFLVSLILSFGFFVSKPVIADSGFDSSWGGGSSSSSDWGSSGSDYSWSSHDSSYGSGSGSDSNVELTGEQLGFIVLMILSFAFIAFLITVYKNSPSRTVLLFMILYSIGALVAGYFLLDVVALIIYGLLFVGVFVYFLEYLTSDIHARRQRDKKINKLFAKSKYSSFNTQELQDELFNIYKDIQLAWSQNNIEPVRNILTDELFNTYQMQIETMIMMKQRNVMEDIKFNRMTVTDISRANNIEQVTVVMEVTCVDYLVQQIDGKEEHIKGYFSKYMKYVYKMTFVRNITKVTTKCPNCGHELNDAMSTKCRSCGGIIIHETDHFVLSKKQMLYEEKL